MWFVFDQAYKNRYVIAGAVFPRAPIPQAWYDAGIAHRADGVDGLAKGLGVDAAALSSTITRFNELAANGIDDDFGRGASRYDQYYGDPTNVPNPNLRPLEGSLYAIKVVLSDLGTCGGIVADERARVMRSDGSPCQVCTQSATTQPMRSATATQEPGRRSDKASCSATSPHSTPPPDHDGDHSTSAGQPVRPFQAFERPM